MEALVLTEPGTLAPKRLPVPEPGPGELLVRVRATGVCGSDLAVYRGTHPYKRAPIVLGHELAGTVERVGAGVAGFAPGDRVCAASFSHCEHCRACRAGRAHLCEAKATLCHRGWNGSFAEYVLLRENMAHRLPDGIGWQVGALVEPLSIGLHAVRIAAQEPGRELAVLGSGNIGLCCLIAARRLGFRTVCVDVRPAAGATALALGAAAFVDAREGDVAGAVRGAIGGPADAVIVAADYPAVCEDALGIAAPGGRAVVVSYFGARDPAVPLNALVGAEMTLTGSALSTPAEIAEVIGWLAAGEIDPRPLIAHVPDLGGAGAAFAQMDSGAGRTGKIVVAVDAAARGGEDA